MTHCKKSYMVKCDECKKIVHYTDDIRKSYAGTVCTECQDMIKQTFTFTNEGYVE